MRCREQALGSMEPELADRAMEIESGTQAQRELARKSLTAWLEDPDLGDVRGREIEMLPDGERGGWLACWEKADAVIKRAS